MSRCCVTSTLSSPHFATKNVNKFLYNVFVSPTTTYSPTIILFNNSLPFYIALAATSFGSHTLRILPNVALVINGACCEMFIGSVFKYYSATVRTFVQGATVILSVWISVALLKERMTWGLGFGTVCVGGIMAFQRGRV